jgi:hypothetical protein
LFHRRLFQLISTHHSSYPTCWIPGEDVLIRYPYAGGTKSFEFFTSAAALFERLRQLPPRTSVIAFRQPQLSLRGIVDDEFIETRLRNIPEGSEFLVVETAQRTNGRASWFHDMAGETHPELRDALKESRGNAVAVGLYPAWLKDDPDLISGYVPDEDGIVRLGAY